MKCYYEIECFIDKYVLNIPLFPLFRQNIPYYLIDFGLFPCCWKSLFDPSYNRIIHAFVIIIIIITYRWSIPLLSLPQDNIQLRTCRTHLHGQGRLQQICSNDFQVENIPIFQTYSYVWKRPINENSTFVHVPWLCQRSFVRRVCLKVRGIPH